MDMVMYFLFFGTSIGKLVLVSSYCCRLKKKSSTNPKFAQIKTYIHRQRGEGPDRSLTPRPLSSL
jgi:hypothetical protein